MSDKVLSIIAAVLIMLGGAIGVIVLWSVAGPVVGSAALASAVGVACALVVILRMLVEQRRMQRSLRDRLHRHSQQLQEIHASLEEGFQGCPSTVDASPSDIAQSERRLSEQIDRASEKMVHLLDARVLGLYETMRKDHVSEDG